MMEKHRERESDGAAVFTGGFIISSGSSGSHYHSLFLWNSGAQGGDVCRGGDWSI